MDPRQAAVAARLLGARLAVPIHYGPLHEAPNYVQAEDPGGNFERAADELGVEARVLRPGERLSVKPAESAESASGAPFPVYSQIKRTGRGTQASE
jgi:L-ascorbate metabolism protein UlaG (beta-lactamase superfamily)